MLATAAIVGGSLGVSTHIARRNELREWFLSKIKTEIENLILVQSTINEDEGLRPSAEEFKGDHKETLRLWPQVNYSPMFGRPQVSTSSATVDANNIGLTH